MRAGNKTVIICDRMLLGLMESTPETVLSAREAVEAFGFGITLGRLNVHGGPSFHRNIMQKYVYGALRDSQSQDSFLKAVRSAVRIELAGTGNSCDQMGGVSVELFQLIRRVCTRSLGEWLLGFDIVSRVPGFVSRFVTLEDMIENATAKCVALPKMAADVLLGQVRSEREKLERDIVAALYALEDSGDSSQGMWMCEALRHSVKGGGHNVLSHQEAATLSVGLMFAAAKNPALATAQSLCYGLQHSLLPLTSYTTRDQDCFDRAFPSEIFDLDLLFQETLRVGAHSVGALRRVVSAKGWHIGPFVVPKGWFVGGSHIVPNAQIFGEPDFKVDHVTRRLSMDLTTFSGGLHACPGKHLAIVTMRCVSHCLLQTLRLEIISPMPPVSFERATLSQRGGPVMIKVFKHE